MRNVLGSLRSGAVLLLIVALALMGMPALGQEAAPALDEVIDAPFEAELEAMEQEESAREDDDVTYFPAEQVDLDDVGGDEDALAVVNGMTNILLIGLDRRPNEKSGRSDTMIIMTLDADHNCIKMVSFQRDLYVEIPGRKNNRLNAAYVFGGPDLLIRTLKQNFGVDIDHYVAVDFSALASVIDQLGGLTITVEDKYVPRVNAIILNDNKVLGLSREDGWLKEGGEQVLTGKQAQAYARYRYGDPKGDAGRTERQREVILKCMDKIKDMSMVDLAQMAIANLDKVETDMSVLDMMALAPAAFQLKDSEVRQMRIPIDGSYSSQRISGMAVYVPNRTKNVNALTAFLLEE